jgi:integrase
MITRKEQPVRNYPGISKRLEFDDQTRKWRETGKYRAMRRTVENGISRKEQAVFDNLEDALRFRQGEIEKAPIGNNAPRNMIPRNDGRITFEELVERWRPFHFLQLERSTQQTYEKRLPNLDFLKRMKVEEINTCAIDALISFWVKSYPKSGPRHTFEKELNLLKVVLNFYRKRIDPSYVIPILDEHYRAADIAKKAQAPVQSLSQEELSLFLVDLKKSKSPIFSSMALTQFCLGLRIGELAGITWEALDLKNGIIRIERTIDWDQITWEPRVKERPKNGKIRVLVMPELLVEELKRLEKVRNPNVPFVFHNNGKPINRQTVAKAYNRALDRLGIKNVRGTHMLRKTSATLANEATGDFYAVSKHLDHSSPNVTLRYVTQTNASKHKIAEALNGVLTQNSMGSVPPGDRVAGNFRTGSSAPVPQCPPDGSSPLLKILKR